MANIPYSKVLKGTYSKVLSKEFGDISRETNKGESGFGKASDRVKAKDHSPTRDSRW